MEGVRARVPKASDFENTEGVNSRKAVHVVEPPRHVTKPLQLFQDGFGLPLATKSLANAYF